jgi:hydroxyproline O-arabinosyltransferase
MKSDTTKDSRYASITDPIVSFPGQLKESDVPGQKRLFHVALTATDAAYSKWQCRIMHYWYKQMREREGSEMGGFTRILHSGKPDNLMDEIPTFVVDPLPAGMDRVRIFVLFEF